MDYMRLLRVLPRDSRTSPVIAFPRTRPDYQTLSNNHLNFAYLQGLVTRPISGGVTNRTGECIRTRVSLANEARTACYVLY